MSKALSKHSSIRKSGNSLVVTIPNEVTKELDLKDGDSVWWNIETTGLFMHIVKLEPPEPSSFKKDEETEGEPA